MKATKRTPMFTPTSHRMKRKFIAGSDNKTEAKHYEQLINDCGGGVCAILVGVPFIPK